MDGETTCTQCGAPLQRRPVLYQLRRHDRCDARGPGRAGVRRRLDARAPLRRPRRAARAARVTGADHDGARPAAAALPRRGLPAAATGGAGLRRARLRRARLLRARLRPSPPLAPPHTCDAPRERGSGSARRSGWSWCSCSAPSCSSAEAVATPRPPPRLRPLIPKSHHSKTTAPSSTAPTSEPTYGDVGLRRLVRRRGGTGQPRARPRTRRPVSTSPAGRSPTSPPTWSTATSRPAGARRATPRAWS